MKRKLIDYDVFERIESDSMSAAQRELVDAEPILSKALGSCGVALRCYGPDTVVYESCDGSFVHATYKIQDKHVVFENIEQLVIDEDDSKKKSKETVTRMVEAILEGDENKAKSHFDSYLEMPTTIRSFKEGAFARTRMQEEAASQEKSGSKCPKCVMAVKKDKCMEWANLCDNVKGYTEFKQFGSVMKESEAQYDKKGNIVGLRLPTGPARNEAKLIQLTWQHMLDTDVKVLRGKAKMMAESQEFCKAIAELKRHNAFSDSDALEEALENIVSKWPEVLYLTEGELSQLIKVALETVNATNYDDQACDFMAEGILRVAHHAYQDRVNKVLTLAGVDQIKEDEEDPYAIFKGVATEFYPSLDEADKVEMDVFVDLYETLREVHKLADAQDNNYVKAETAAHLDELVAILKQEAEPTMEVLTSAAKWLTMLVETNLETQDWVPSNSTHQTVQGDHPAMAQKAKHPYVPARDFSGDWGDSAPVSDGKNYKGGLADEMRSRSWGNVGGSDTYPALQNPYIPKPFGDYTGTEKGVDKASDSTGQWTSGDTWPNLQNPYIPSAETPQSYKMNKGAEKDLVVDK